MEEEYDLLVTEDFRADPKFDMLMELIASPEFASGSGRWAATIRKRAVRSSMLKDNFNRVINYLRVSITDRCNLRCRYCTESIVPFIPHDEILRYEEILRFVRVAASLGVRKVRLTGGEPLQRRGLAFLIKEIDSLGLIEDISLTTNGVDPGGRSGDELRACGLRRVNISLDSLKPERFAYITGLTHSTRL